jgi:DNA-binding Lrp family transcriptional regulator
LSDRNLCRLADIFFGHNIGYILKVSTEMPVKVFLAATVKPGKAKDVQKNLRTIEEVVLACTVSDGPYDVVAIVEVSSLDDYRNFSIDRVSAVQHMVDYTSFIIMDE